MDADGTELTAVEAIRTADRLLPGKDRNDGPSPRWQAVIAVGEFVESDPEPVWEFVKRWGSSPVNDLRDAIATCVMEHLLESHFDAVFPKVEQEAHANPLFADMVRRCWKFGECNIPANSARFDALITSCRKQHPKRQPGSCSGLIVGAFLFGRHGDGGGISVPVGTARE